MAIFPVKKRNQTFDSSLEFLFDYEEPSRGYLKKMALETVISFIARSVSLSEFQVTDNKKPLKNDTYYSLNVRPNTDTSASAFWYEFTYKLIHDNEVLVVVDDSGDLLIVDSFQRVEYAVYPDIFRNVTVKDYMFDRTFSMDEVIYLKFGNEKITKFLDGMFKDYTDLFNRLVETNLRSNQIRATVSIDTTQKLDEESQGKLQKFINNMYKSFREKSIAIVPKLKGFEYDEISSGVQSSSSIADINALKTSLIDEVADILGVPQKLIHGDIADIDSLIKSYVKFCINPINKLIQDELNAKLIDKDKYLVGERIKVRGIQVKDIFELSTSIDKLISSGSFTRNDVREFAGEERSDDVSLDEYVLTRNYMSLEGGENNEENN